MDPLTIAGACVGLLSSITALSMKFGPFVARVREARRDVDAIRREIASLQLCIENLHEDTANVKINYPPHLQKSLVEVLKECDRVISEIKALLDRCSSDNLAHKMRWAVVGREEMEKLRSRLEAHKTTFDIALECISISLISSVKEDTTVIKDNTQAILDGNEHIQQQTAQLLAEITTLKAKLSEAESREAPVDRAFVMQRFLEQSTNYAGSVIADEAPWQAPERASPLEILSPITPSSRTASQVPSRTATPVVFQLLSETSCQLPADDSADDEIARRSVEIQSAELSEIMDSDTRKSISESGDGVFSELSSTETNASQFTSSQVSEKTTPPDDGVREVNTLESVPVLSAATTAKVSEPSRVVTTPNEQNDAIKGSAASVSLLPEKDANRGSFLRDNHITPSEVDMPVQHDPDSSRPTTDRHDDRRDDGGDDIDDEQNVPYTTSEAIALRKEAMKLVFSNMTGEKRLALHNEFVGLLSTWKIRQNKITAAQAFSRIKDLLSQGVPPDTRVKNMVLVGSTVVHFSTALQACICHWPEAANFVALFRYWGSDLTQTANIEPECKSLSGTALATAALANSVIIVKYLLDHGVPVDITGGKYHTALQAAARAEAEPVMHLLLERGANVNIQGGRCGNALAAAALGSKPIAVLIKKGANVNSKAGTYGSPLAAAARNGSIENVKKLIEAGAKLNLYGPDAPSSPIVCAASRPGQTGLEVLRILISHGADVYDDRLYRLARTTIKRKKDDKSISKAKLEELEHRHKVVKAARGGGGLFSKLKR